MTLTFQHPETSSAPVVHPADLISHLLREQSTLSAVEQFSDWHQQQSEPEQARHYRDLLPLSLPTSGQQLAFEVDLDRCSGCKACVVACHTLNGLDEAESFRDVGLLLGTTDCSPAFQHVTTACHHCIDPGCLNACPVNAYEKDQVTGIVRHLDDQCFGCQYCTLACPYEVPKYNAAKGIVRKCDMCSQRLANGEAPACVQACPHQAISIRTIEVADAIQAAATNSFLANSPHAAITIPTTRYPGRSVSDTNQRSGGYAVPALEQAHWPLVILLVLSQIAVGIVLLVMLMNNAGLWESDTPATSVIIASTKPRSLLLAIATALAGTGAVCSTLHLGRPQFAYRAVLGVRHSWLSREIIAFGIFMPLCLAGSLFSLFDWPWQDIVTSAAAIAGVAGVIASLMIYHVTRRPFWNVRYSGPAFFATMTGLSSLVVLTTLQVSSAVPENVVRVLCCLAAISGVIRIVLLRQALRASSSISQIGSPLLKTSRQLRIVSTWGFAVLCGMLLIRPAAALLVPVIGVAILIGAVAEFSERYHFFRAVVPLRMPGVVKL